MARRSFKYTPGDLLKRLDQYRYSFMSHVVREKIDELMELVTFDAGNYQRIRNSAVRWHVIPNAEQQKACDRFTVCMAVYCLMVDDGMEMQAAIRSLLEAGALPYSRSGLRKDRHGALRALGLAPDFAGLRSVKVWLDKLHDVPQSSGYDQVLALVPAAVLKATEDKFITALAEGQRHA